MKQVQLDAQGFEFRGSKDSLLRLREMPCVQAAEGIFIGENDDRFVVVTLTSMYGNKRWHLRFGQWLIVEPLSGGSMVLSHEDMARAGVILGEVERES